jgi:hypothetical protein
MWEVREGEEWQKKKKGGGISKKEELSKRARPRKILSDVTVLSTGDAVQRKDEQGLAGQKIHISAYVVHLLHGTPINKTRLVVNGYLF